MMTYAKVYKSYAYKSGAGLGLRLCCGWWFTLVIGIAHGEEHINSTVLISTNGIQDREPLSKSATPYTNLLKLTRLDRHNLET